MKNKVVEYMVPLDRYATVGREASIADAVAALMDSQADCEAGTYRNRAILIRDQAGKVVGKVNMHDILRGLEPGYRRIQNMDSLSKLGFSANLVKSTMEEYDLWQHPLADICTKAAATKVADFMHKPSQSEYITAQETLDHAIHQLIMGNHQSLLVTDQGDVVGVLRLSDVIAQVCRLIRQCEL